jgi:hypothetical protein
MANAADEILTLFTPGDNSLLLNWTSPGEIIDGGMHDFSGIDFKFGTILGG